jgi:hypothetical protein
MYGGSHWIWRGVTAALERNRGPAGNVCFLGVKFGEKYFTTQCEKMAYKSKE